MTKKTPATHLGLATEEPIDLVGRLEQEAPPKKWKDRHAWLPCLVCKETTKARHFVFESPWSSKWVPLHMLCAKSETYYSSLRQEQFIFAGQAANGLVIERIAIANKKARDAIIGMLSQDNKDNSDDR